MIDTGKEVFNYLGIINTLKKYNDRHWIPPMKENCTMHQYIQKLAYTIVDSQTEWYGKIWFKKKKKC